jgi:predicted nucleotidyltransferase
MPRDTGRNDRRSQIAHWAARLMAEDGIEDYGLAKRKAARQAGAADSRDLPTNDEIEAALHTYRQIYQESAHRARLQELRQQALQVMLELSEFDPHLTGSVLNGSAGPYADIQLQLFTDNQKAVELYLIDRNIPYRPAQRRLYAGAEPLTVPVFTLDREYAGVELTVLSRRELRTALRSSLDGQAIERVRTPAVEAMLEQD